MNVPFRKNVVFILAAAALAWIVPPAAGAQQPTTREYPYLYKSPRAMGMGGAYTAVGGRVDTLFYNPAGLSTIPQDKGWEVNLLGITAEYSKNARDFVDDMGDAVDVPDSNGDGDDSDERLQAVNDVLAKYRGKPLHLRVADFTSVGKSFDRFAFGIGGLASGRIDAVAHQGFGTDGFLEVNADATYGGIGGVSISLTPDLIAGVAVKSLHRETLIHNFTEREFIDNQDNLGDYIQKDLRKGGDGVGLDAGMLWRFAPLSPLKPAVGASILNIGDLSFGRAGKVPQSVNIGVSVNPTIPIFRSLIVAADYVDVLNNFKEDKDKAKRLRFGAELQLFDIWASELTVRAGMYEGYPTAGLDLRLLVFTFSYAMYTEEVGAYAGQDKDKRQLFFVNIGW